MIAIGITYFGGPGARSCYLYSVIHVVQMVASSVTKPEDLKGRLDKFKLNCETPGRRGKHRTFGTASAHGAGLPWTAML